MEVTTGKINTEAWHSVSEQDVRDALTQLLNQYPQGLVNVDMDKLELDARYPIVHGSYSRNRIYLDEYCEVVVAVWDKSMRCSAHNHGESKCAFILISGSLSEQSVTPCPEMRFSEQICSSRELIVNDFYYIDNRSHFHFIENQSDEVSVSVHLYNPPLSGVTVLEQFRETRVHSASVFSLFNEPSI